MSLERLQEHRAIWERKPVLRDVYAVWFRALLAALPARARVVEVGAGPGFLAPRARRERADLRWIATDLIATGWNDVAADALRLPLRDNSVDAVAGLDVLHHLAQPGDFFRECARVLPPGGRLVLVEPWITPLSYPVYRFFHQEHCTLGVDPWDPFAAQGRGAKDAFAGDAAVPWRLARAVRPEQWAGLGFLPPAVTTLNGFAYLLSLGFRSACLLPRWLAPPLRALDASTRMLSRWTGLRALVVWQRPRAASDTPGRPCRG